MDNAVEVDDAGSDGDSTFHDASKSPLPSPSKPLKSILTGSMNSMNHLTIDLNDLDTIYSDVAVASVPPSVDCSNTLYSMDSSKLPTSPSRRSVFSAESSIMDMSTVMDTVVEGENDYDEMVEFVSPPAPNKNNKILQALMAIDAPKIVAANQEIEREEERNDNIIDCSQDLPQSPRKIPSIISEESRATDFSYNDIADHVDPERDFASILMDQDHNSPSSHSRNYLSNFLARNTPASPPKRRSSMASEVSDVSSVTYMSRAMLERSLEEAIPEVSSSIEPGDHRHTTQYSIVCLSSVLITAHQALHYFQCRKGHQNCK